MLMKHFQTASEGGKKDEIKFVLNERNYVEENQLKCAFYCIKFVQL